MIEVKDLLDLSKTIASSLFDGVSYPWEALDQIKEYILQLGQTLPEEEFDHPSADVWIAKDATVFPSAYLGGPLIVDHRAEIRHCAFIRGSAIVGKRRCGGQFHGAEKRGAVRRRAGASLQLCRRFHSGLQGPYGRRLDHLQRQSDKTLVTVKTPAGPLKPAARSWAPF